MIKQPVLKYVPIAVLICPCCTRKKKPFKSIKSLNGHISKSHTDYEYKIEIIKNGVYKPGSKNVDGDVIVATRKSTT